MTKGQVNMTIEMNYRYGFEIIDDDNNILMEYVDTDSKLSQEEIEAMHDKILQRKKGQEDCDCISRK